MFFLSFRGCFISDGIELLTDQQIVGEIRGTLPGEYEKRTCLSHGVYSHVFAINFNTDKQTWIEYGKFEFKERRGVRGGGSW